MGDILEPIFGENSVAVLIGLVVAVLLIGGAYWFIRRSPRDAAGSLRGRPPRLAVVESIPVDSKRQLVLVRRDGVEHLLLVGGLTDLVVEATILRNRQRSPRPAAAGSPTPSAPQPAPPQPAPPPPAEKPAERASDRLRAIRARKSPVGESRLTDRPATTRREPRLEAEPLRPPSPVRPPPAERITPPPPSPPTPEPPPAPPAAPQPDTLQAALAAAEAHEPDMEPPVTIAEAASPEERYREGQPSPFAPGGQNQPAVQSPFAPNREPQVLPTAAPAAEEPVRPAPGAAPYGQTERGEQANTLEKDMARLLGQISEDRRSDNA